MVTNSTRHARRSTSKTPSVSRAGAVVGRLLPPWSLLEASPSTRASDASNSLNSSNSSNSGLLLCEMEELKKRHASWCKSLQRAVETDGWGQVIEAVEAYERCERVPLSVRKINGHDLTVHPADWRCSSHRRRRGSTSSARTKRCVAQVHRVLAKSSTCSCSLAHSLACSHRCLSSGRSRRSRARSTCAQNA